ncbi:MAG TPA: galactokinase [Candidatus Atribacteria bacterium]|nr:galactokinase [Candidatus Atribacteria bacterium]
MQNINKLWKIFSEKFADTGLTKGAFSAPGRVNLIGEHTDYNEGFVLPMAIGKKIIMLGQLRNDRLVQVFDLGFQAGDKFSLDNLSPSQKDIWVNYLMGVADEIQKAGYSLQGANLIFTSDIPQRAGLSSSAALEVVTALTITKLNLREMKPIEMAHLCRRAENNFVGVSCGIMDQYVSCLGQKNYALFIDCRSNEYELVPFKDHNYQIVICNSKVQRGLVNSEYNKRREECKRAVDFFKHKLNREIRSLRDITIDEYKIYQSQLPEVIARRSRHVLSENDRVQTAVQALRMKNYPIFGQLMIESHKSLKDDYEVSCKELDFLVDLALKQEGVLGSRMTGAGFGGCTVNLLKKEHVDAFKKTIVQEYRKNIGITPDIYITSPAEGAKVLEFR